MNAKIKMSEFLKRDKKTTLVFKGNEKIIRRLHIIRNFYVLFRKINNYMLDMVNLNYYMSKY